MEEITDLTVKFFGKFGRTRWLSLNPILKRIYEQLPNLMAYFCEFMPAQKEFRQQMNSATTKARYDRIVKAFNSPTMEAYVLFTMDLCSTVFEPFLVKFQEKTSLVHLLYDSLGELVFKLMMRIYNDNQLSNGGVTLQLDDLLALDMNRMKSRELVDVTNKCAKYMEECKDINERLFKATHDNFRDAIKKCVLHLSEKLPRNNEFLQCVRSINPKSVTAGSSEKEIEKLAKLIILKTIKSQGAAQRLFGVSHDRSDIVDSIRRQYKLLAIEKGQESSLPSAQEFWKNIRCQTSDDGELKFKEIGTLAQICLTVDHCNATPERGFSVNNNIVTDDRCNLDEETIVAIRFVNDFMSRYAAITDFAIDKRLLQHAKESHSRYKQHLETKKVQEEKKKKEREEKQEKDTTKHLIKEIKTKIVMEQAKFELSETMIKEVGKNLEDLSNNTTNKNFKKDLAKTNARMQIALTQKTQSMVALADLNAKMKELE